MIYFFREYAGYIYTSLQGGYDGAKMDDSVRARKRTGLFCKQRLQRSRSLPVKCFGCRIRSKLRANMELLGRGVGLREELSWGDMKL